MTAHFVNDPAALVPEALDGLVGGAGPSRLARLDGYPDIKVVLRADWDRADQGRDRVAVVSGGGAGHEPAHAGFVGPGLLTAAVSGEVFASPSVDAVLAALLAVTGEAGCLLVVKNYTGDRLNFGLAAERARAAGLRVEMVVVGDDIAIPDTPAPRGLAGTLLVHKVAGALAQSGVPLDQVAGAARRVAAGVRSLGISTSGADIPGRSSEQRFVDGSAELGLGIHGEPGVETFALGRDAEIVDRMAAALTDALPDGGESGAAGGDVVLLLNTLGGLAPLEALVVVRDLLATPLGQRARLLIGPAALMTSMSMRGFSMSALAVDDELARALLANCAAWTAWPGARELGPHDRLRVLPVPTLREAGKVLASEDTAVRAVLTAVTGALIDAEQALDALDAKVGDGDTGSTFAAAARRVLSELDALPLADRSALFARLSELLGSAMGGSSGVLLSILFAAAGSVASTGSTGSAGSVGSAGGDVPLADALAAGADAVQRHGGAGEGDRTMLDALLPAVRALRDGGAAAAAAAARSGADATGSMEQARAGRAAYVGGQHLRGVVDPGAEAVAIAFAAAATHR